tara:strand:+ start:2024 stop:2392 length:369 start_codon:yes stop_codon:yes gene_type:complete
MGYRSDVVLAVSEELMPHFLGALAKTPEARAFVFKDHCTMEENYDGKKTFLVHWSSVKWYDSFPGVAAVQEFVDDCFDDKIDGFEDIYENYRFIRLGEDTSDMEEKGSLCSWDICFHRSIAF